MAFTEEQIGLAQRDIPGITLMLAFYKKFGEDALEVVREWAFESGKMRGEAIKRRMGIQGTDARAIEALIKAVSAERYDKETLEKKLVRVSVEGNKIIAVNEGFCPVMAAVKMLDAPWSLVCPNYSVPTLLGVASAVNPKVKGDVPNARWKGNKFCEHITTILE
jgi:hypothetical protein